MAVNKVIYGGNTLVDLTGDTVTAADLADGVKATGADGNPVIGLMQKVTIDSSLSNTSTNPVQNKVIKAELDKKMAKTDKIYEANLAWGGKDVLDGFSPIDAAMVPELGSDHFCFFPPSNVDIEYSIDGGKTWLDYDSTIDRKWKLFSLAADYTIGKCTSNNQSTDNLLRITMRAANAIYTQIKKFIFYVSTNGSRKSYVTIETQKDGSDFKAYGGKHYLEGWSGYTVVNFKIIPEQSITGDFRFGTTSYCNADTIRFTFGHEGFMDNNPYIGLTIKRIMAFGGTCWSAPSNMATNGHLYSYNYLQEVRFPANVTVPNLIGMVNGYTISASVPANAKFTDTIYTHPSTHPASMITGLSTVATSGSYNDLKDKPAIVKTVNNVAPDSDGNINITVGDGGGSTDTANTWTAAQKFGDVVFDGVGKYKNEKITQVSGQEVRPTTQYAVIMPDGSSTLAINLQELLAQTSPDYTDVLHFRFIITTQSRSITLRVFSDHGTVFAPENTSLGGSISILEGCALSGASGIAFITVTNMELIGNEAIA